MFENHHPFFGQIQNLQGAVHSEVGAAVLEVTLQVVRLESELQTEVQMNELYPKTLTLALEMTPVMK